MLAIAFFMPDTLVQHTANAAIVLTAYQPAKALLKADNGLGQAVFPERIASLPVYLLKFGFQSWRAGRRKRQADNNQKR